MPGSSPVRSSTHRKLLQHVYDQFTEKGTWPTARSVRLAIRRDGDLTEMCRELGSTLIVCNLGDSTASTCELRVHALLYVEGAERDKTHIAAAIQHLIKRYMEDVETHEKVEVSSTEFEAVLQFTETDARRVTKWLNYAPMITRTFAPDTPDRRATLWVSDEILRLEGITGFEDYLQRADEIEGQFVQRAKEHGAKVKRLFKGERSLSRVPDGAIVGRPKGNRVFVVHGHDEEMKQAVARLLERLGCSPVILHEQPDRGRTVIEKVEDYADVSFAIVLLTPDDVGAPVGTPAALRPRARQNVMFELGFFVGSLGRENVCALHRGGVEIPSDYSGVLWTPYDDAGAWRLKLAKELRAAGIEVDADALLG